MENQIINFFTELLFPSFCLGCKKEGQLLCQDCRAILDISEYDYCLCSKDPLRLPAPDEQARLTPLAQGKLNGKCNRCKSKKLSGLYSALPYNEKALTKKLIYNFKYEPYIKNLSKVISSIILEHFDSTNRNTENFWNNSILIPIPIDKKKLKRRGYNQSEEIAKEISKHTKSQVLTDILFKIKLTDPQMELSKEEREHNLKGAFIAKNLAKIKNKKVFLVDDVYTTGSTMEECANVLRTDRTNGIFGIVFAREG